MAGPRRVCRDSWCRCANNVVVEQPAARRRPVLKAALGGVAAIGAVGGSRARLARRRPRDGLPHPDARRLGVRGDRRAGGTSRRSAARPSRRRRPLGDDGPGLHGVLDARADLGRAGDRARGGGTHALRRRMERLAAGARAGRPARRHLRRGVERRRHGPDVDRDLRRRAGARRPVAAERAHPRAAEPLGAAGRRRRGRRARRTSRHVPRTSRSRRPDGCRGLASAADGSGARTSGGATASPATTAPSSRCTCTTRRAATTTGAATCPR